MIEKAYYIFMLAACVGNTSSMQRVTPVQELTTILLSDSSINESPSSNKETALYSDILPKLNSGIVANPPPQQIKQVITTQGATRIIEEYENIHYKKVAERNALIVKRNTTELHAHTARRSAVRYSSGLVLFTLCTLALIIGESQIDVNWGRFLTQNNLLFLVPFLYLAWKIPAGTMHNCRKYRSLKQQIPHLENAIELYANKEAQFNPDDDIYWQRTKITTLNAHL